MHREQRSPHVDVEQFVEMLFGDSPKGIKFAHAGIGENNIDSANWATSPCTPETLVPIAFWRDKAQKTISAFAARLQSDPDAIPALASALDSQLAQTKQILIAGDPASPDTRELLRQVNTRFLPNKILLVADGGAGQQS